MHDAPGRPHAPTPAGVQTPAMQQPVGQLVASQTHAPFEQRSPAPHGCDEPQRQLPPPVQVSVFTGSQPTQAAPFFPHAVVLGVAHVFPVQQPSGQLVALQPLQVPAAQGPPSQLWHAAPPAPQLADAVPERQVPSAEQHPEQLAVSQTQLPPPSAVPAHRWPAAHAGPLPQRHAPFTHAVVAAPPHATQAPPAVPHADTDAALHMPP